MGKLLPLSFVLLAASTAVYAQTYTVIHDFGSKPGDPQPSSSRPAAIAQGRGGAMLTTAGSKAIKISTSGSLQILDRLDAWPYSGLHLARDGRFYGTTMHGGTFNQGTIINMSPEGTVTTLYNFTGASDGSLPESTPIQSIGGDVYGTTPGNFYIGTPPYGSVYKITRDGTFTLLHAFPTLDSDGGAAPLASLVQGTDDYFYGTTRGGYSTGAGLFHGTIFRVSSTGDFRVLATFNGTNGDMPTGLVQANDGNLYGVTMSGGSSRKGVLFRIKPGGTLTVLHNFTAGPDGGMPFGNLVQGSDGNLYGSTWQGGTNGYGVIFRATLSGDVVSVHDFDPASGSFSMALFQHTNGILYGDTCLGGAFGKGVFYSLDAGLPPFVTYLPVYGKPGAVVQILGQGFTDTSQVFFNGTPAASVIVGYPTFIKAVVPDGATTGPITVTTSTGTLTSNKVFVVHP